MKLYFLILLTILILVGCGSNRSKKDSGDKIENNKSNEITSDSNSLKKPGFLQDILRVYDTSKVLTAFYLNFGRELPNFTKIIDTSTFSFKCGIENYFDTTDRKSILNRIDSEVNKMGVQQANFYEERISLWCENDIILNIILNSKLNDKNLFFEELISETPHTKHLMNKYVKFKGQDWGSLDINQSCELYYDVLQYLANLNETERLDFYEKYFSTSFKLLKKSKRDKD